MTILLLVAALPMLAAALVVGATRPLQVLLPLYAMVVPFGSSLAPPGLPASYFSASSLIAVVLTSSLAARLLTSEPGPGRVPSTAVVWLFFTAAAGVTINWTVAAADTASGLINLFAVVALFVAVRLCRIDAGVVARTEWGIVTGGAFVAAYGLYQVAVDGLVAGDVGDPRFGRDLTDPNHIAAALLLPFAIALHRTLGRSSALERVFMSFVAVAIVLAVLLTGSRGGVLGLLLVYAVLGATSVSRIKSVAIGVLAAAVVGGFLFAFPGTVNDRLTSGDSSGRADIWKVGLNSCPQYCLVGSGFGTFGEVYAQTLPRTPEAGAQRKLNMNPHNILVGVVVEVGVIGLALMLIGLLLTLRESLSIAKGARAPAVAALSGVYLSGMFLGNFTFKYFWLALLYVGLLVAVQDDSELDVEPSRAQGRG